MKVSLRGLTHFFALLIGMIYAFFLSPQGQQFSLMYPRVHMVICGFLTMGALYYNPNGTPKIGG